MGAFNRKWWSRIGLRIVGTLLAIQVVPYGREHANPPVTAEPTWDAPETRTLAKRACFHCHSNDTERPVYASIAPASWLVQRDVNEGRAVLNFSEWWRPQEEAKEEADFRLEQNRFTLQVARAADTVGCVPPQPSILAAKGLRFLGTFCVVRSRRASPRDSLSTRF